MQNFANQSIMFCEHEVFHICPAPAFLNCEIKMTRNLLVAFTIVS
jgi:hypothetical protein